MLWGAPGGAQFHSEGLEKPEAVCGGEGDWACVFLLMLHSFVLSSVVPGCAHGRRRTESPPR